MACGLPVDSPDGVLMRMLALGGQREHRCILYATSWFRFNARLANYSELLLPSCRRWALRQAMHIALSLPRIHLESYHVHLAHFFPKMTFYVWSGDLGQDALHAARSGRCQFSSIPLGDWGFLHPHHGGCRLPPSGCHAFRWRVDK